MDADRARPPPGRLVYGPGDSFESEDVNHTVHNETDAPMVHLLSEMLPAALSRPSLIPVRHR